MAVAVYQPASAGCPGDDDPENPCESDDPPAYCANAGSCLDANIEDDEHRNVLEVMETEGVLMEMWNRSDELGLESFSWIEQDPETGSISSRQLEGEEGNTLPCFVLTVPGAAPDHAIGYAHTHPRIGETRSCRRNPLDASAGHVDFTYTESYVSDEDHATVTEHNLDFGIMVDSEVIIFLISMKLTLNIQGVDSSLSLIINHCDGG